MCKLKWKMRCSIWKRNRYELQLVIYEPLRRQRCKLCMVVNSNYVVVTCKTDNFLHNAPEKFSYRKWFLALDGVLPYCCRIERSSRKRAHWPRKRKFTCQQTHLWRHCLPNMESSQRNNSVQRQSWPWQRKRCMGPPSSFCITEDERKESWKKEDRNRH